MNHDPGTKKFSRVSSKAGGVKHCPCWGGRQYWEQNELVNQVSGPSGAVLGAQAVLTLGFSKLNVRIPFAPVSAFPFSLLLPTPHHGYLLVASPLFSPLLSDISGTPRTGSPCNFPQWTFPLTLNLPASIPGFMRSLSFLLTCWGNSARDWGAPLKKGKEWGEKRKQFLFSSWLFSKPGVPSFLLQILPQTAGSWHAAMLVTPSRKAAVQKPVEEITT